MKLSELETFLKVAETGSFTKAAQKLFITQPTVTHHVQALEEELGCQLFVRSSSSIRLTAKGKEVAEKVDDLFKIVDEIKGSTKQESRELTGTLNIAASSVMGAYFLPPVLKIFGEKHSGIHIRLSFGSAYTIANWVQSGFVDLGFAPLSPGFSKLKSTLMKEEPCVAATSAELLARHGNDFAKGSLAGQPLVLREKGTKVHELAMRWCKKQPWHTPSFTPVVLGDMEAIKNLVLISGGVTIMPRCCIDKELRLGLMAEIPLAVPIGTIRYYMLERGTDEQSEFAGIVDAFLSEITSHTEKGSPS